MKKFLIYLIKKHFEQPVPGNSTLTQETKQAHLEMGFL